MRAPISVVMPVRNGLPLLLESLASIAGQSYRPAELIVVDDGSSDGTADAVRKFADGFETKLIELGTSLGPAAARNAGIRASRSGHISFLDADDLWSADAAGSLARALEASAEAGIARGTIRNFRVDTSGGQQFFTAPYRSLQVAASHEASLTHGLTGPGFGAVPVFARRIQRIRAGTFDPAAHRHMTQADYLALTSGPPDPDRTFHGVTARR